MNRDIEYLKSCLEDVTKHGAKLGEVYYGDDGVDMAEDILAVLAIAEAAIGLYDGLDIDRLDPEYFGSGSEGRQYRGLRNAIRSARSKETK